MTDDRAEREAPPPSSAYDLAPDDRAVFDPDAIGEEDEGLTGTERYQGYLEAGTDPSGTDESVDVLITDELRSGETSDPNIAADEGLTYIAPIDPPVVPSDDPDGAMVAAGSAPSARHEPYDLDHHDEFLGAEDEMTGRVREALRADAATSRFADRLEIETEAGVVTIRGQVDDFEDGDAVAAVASIVTGVTDVRDETEVPGL